MKYAKLTGAILFTFFFLCPALAQTEKEIKQINLDAYNIKDADLDSAFALSDFVLKTIDRIKDDTLRSDIYSVRGTLYQMDEEYKIAIQYHLKALRIRNRLNYIPKIATSKLNIANAHYKIGDYKKSRKYYLECLNHLKEAPENYKARLKNYNGLGTLYHSMEKNDSAYYFFGQALKIIKDNQLEHTMDAGDVYLNFGMLQEDRSDYKSALNYFEKAIEIQIAEQDLSGLSLSYHHIGILNELENQFSIAKSYYKRAFSLANKLDNTEGKRDISLSYAKLYSKQNNGDSANYYFDQYRNYEQEILVAINNKAINELETKYQFEKKDEQIKLQKSQNESMWLGIILGTIIVFTFLFFLIRNYRQKQRIALMQLDLKNHEIDELLTGQETASYAAMLEGQDHERLRIAQDLHDRLGSTLAAIKLGMQGNPEVTAPQNLQLVDTAITEVRAIAHNLSGGNIERYGLNSALQELKTTIEGSGKIAVDLYLEDCSLNNQLNIELYRIVQELVSNTLKHADASVITIQTNNQPDNFNLIYEDNGNGFDSKAANPGMGIRNIHHRLNKWDGHLAIDSKPGRGSILIINLPKNTN